MSSRNNRTAALVLCACLLPSLSRGDDGRSRTVEVKSTRSKQTVETWERVAKPGRVTVRATGADGELSIATEFQEPGSARISYELGGKRGQLVVKDGRAARRLPAEVIDAAKRAQTRVASYRRGHAAGFDLVGRVGVSEGFWDCEWATLNVIVWCGAFQLDKCEQAVNAQFCACAPGPKPPACP
jgi:hypothetical protein